MDKITYFVSDDEAIQSATVSLPVFIERIFPTGFLSVTIHSAQTNLDYLGIPKEFVDFLNPNISPNFSITNVETDEKKCYFILKDIKDDPNFLISLQVIKAFNLLQRINFVMIVPESMIPAISCCANENIRFQGYRESMKLSNPSLVLGQGDIIIESILLGIPAIVTGKRGLGGNVDDESIQHFIRYNFEGRHGASLEEQIPPHLLRYIIEERIKSENGKISPSLSQESFELIKKVYCSLDLNQHKLIKTDSLSNLLRQLQIRDKELKPKLCNNIKITKMNNGDAIIYNTLNDHIIASVESQTVNILYDCVGAMNIAQLMDKHFHEEEEIFDFLVNLYEERIIHFN